MSVTFDPFTGPGSTPARRRFWDDAMSLAQASRKLPGINVKVDEYPSGSVISVPDARNKTQGAPVTGACCADDGSGCSITPDESTCLGISGRWQGVGTTCDDIICAACGDCHCAFFSPVFNPGDGLCYTHQDDNCGVITYSGIVDCGALFAIQQGTLECCAGEGCGTGSCSQTFYSFCNYIDPLFPFCDTFTDGGCDVPIDCGSCPTHTTADLLGQVFDVCSGFSPAP